MVTSFSEGNGLDCFERVIEILSPVSVKTHPYINVWMFADDFKLDPLPALAYPRWRRAPALKGHYYCYLGIFTN